MRTFYLVRHGRPDFPEGEKPCIGRTDLPLSQEGRRQMEALRRQLAGKGIRRIYASPLSRCVESARILSGGQIPVTVLEELREIDMGAWEGLPFSEIRERYPEEYAARGQDMAYFTPPGGESFAACQKRARKALEQIRAEGGGSCVLLAHAGVNRALISWKENRPLEELLRIPQEYGSVYAWEEPVWAGLITAAGLSSRMGDFKPLMPLGGQTVMGRILDTLRQGGVGEVAVVTGYRGEDIRAQAGGKGLTFLSNPDFATTRMFDSVRIGLRYWAEKADSPEGRDLDGVYFSPVDTPLFSEYTLRREAEAFASGTEAVYVPAYQGQPGHPILIRRTALEALLAHDGEQGLRGAYARLGDSAVAQVEVPDAGCVPDADTPEDFRRLQDLLQSRQRPDEAECRRLLAFLGTPEATVRHGEAVAELAREMGRACGAGLDLDLLWAGGLLHDLAKGQPDHARAGGRFLRQLGYGPVAQVVEEHTDLPLYRLSGLNESLLVFLADKRIRGTERVSLEERFSVNRRRFAGNPEALAALERRYACAKKAEALVREKGFRE